MSKKKLFKISAACAGLLMGLGLISEVKAGVILRNSPVGTTSFSQFPSIESSYKVSYEIYNPGGTATSSATTQIGFEFASSEITGGAVNPDWTVAFNFLDSDAQFSTIGPNYVWILADSGGNIYAGSTVGAIGPMITLTSGNVDLGAQGIGNMPAGEYWLYQVSWADGDGDNMIEPLEVGPFINPTVILLRKQASCTESPVWPLTASISGSNGNIGFPIVSFAYVTPQFRVVGPGTDSLNAELNTDEDFRQFILGSGPNVSTQIQIFATVDPATGFFNIQDLQLTEPDNWIVWTVGRNGAISFDLTSVASEPGVSIISFAGVDCREITNDLRWQCDSGPRSPLIGPLDLELDIDGATENNPTIWNISNVNITADYCYTPPAGPVGAWWGGVEAIVPFVKYDPAVGAETYIVLYNRRDVGVPVYGAALLMDSNPTVTTINLIDTIPPHGRIELRASEMPSLLPELAGYDMSRGVPIKLLFRVPTQATTIQGGGNISLPTYTFSGNFNNPFDPYIEGIVVSVYGSEQRTIPLKFKAFRQGNYNE